MCSAPLDWPSEDAQPLRRGVHTFRDDRSRLHAASSPLESAACMEQQGSVSDLDAPVACDGRLAP